jgi:hypothetical protein
MGDLAMPERAGGRHAAVRDRDAVPAMPVIQPNEQITVVPYPLIDGISPTIGWQFRPQAKGGPAFMIIRRSGLGSLKAAESFPLTEDGWASAWRSLVAQNPAAAPKVLAVLAAREAEAARLSPQGSGEVAELDALSLAILRDVAYLGGLSQGRRSSRASGTTSGSPGTGSWSPRAAGHRCWPR